MKNQNSISIAVRLIILIFVSATALSACAPAIPVQEARLASPASSTPAIKELQREATVRLSSGYERKLAVGSRWRLIGTLPQGDVLRPMNGIFTIEGRQVHEAYLVVSGTRLVGFYLPGETHFSPLDSPVSLTFGEQ